MSAKTHRREQSGFSLVSLMEHCTTEDIVTPLDGGPGDHDHADSETDTQIPDDDDIASLASNAVKSVQPSNCLVRPRVAEVVFGQRWLSRTTTRTSSFAAQCRPTIFTLRTSSTTTGLLGRL